MPGQVQALRRQGGLRRVGAGPTQNQRKSGWTGKVLRLPLLARSVHPASEEADIGTPQHSRR
eukprot:scaffold344337_cov56-Prasinocladus_malaysianus.AAC.1